MKSSIITLMDSYAFDNSEYAAEAGQTIAEHMIATCEATDWNWFFTDEELESGISAEMIAEVRKWLIEDYS